MVDNSELTTISELTQHAIYTVRVQAYTTMGPGPMSNPVQVKTQQGEWHVSRTPPRRLRWRRRELGAVLGLFCSVGAIGDDSPCASDTATTMTDHYPKRVGE